MNETKQIVYNFDNVLLQKECCIQITRQQLLKDKTDKIYAQINLKNLGKRPIKAVFIRIEEYNILHEIISQNFEYQYLDLDIWRGQEFGNDIFIELKHVVTREIKTYIEKIVYLDGKIWTNTNHIEPESFEESKLMTDVMSEELVEQYKRESNEDNYVADDDVYYYEETEDNWWCTCGAWNFSDELRCYKCGKQRAWIKKTFDQATLSRKLEEYNQQQQNYKQHIKSVTDNIKQKQPNNKINDILMKIKPKDKKKTGFIAIGIILIVILGSVLFSQYNYHVASNSLSQYEHDFTSSLGDSPDSYAWGDYIQDGDTFSDGDIIESEYSIAGIKGSVRGYIDTNNNIGKVTWEPNNKLSESKSKKIIEYMKKKYGDVDANDEYTASETNEDLYSWTEESDDYNIFLSVDEDTDEKVTVILEENDYQHNDTDNNSTYDYDDDDSTYDDSTDDDTPEVTGSGSFQGGAAEEYENR